MDDDNEEDSDDEDEETDEEEREAIPKDLDLNNVRIDEEEPRESEND